MTTQMKALVDKLLTDVSQKIVPQGFLCDAILPKVKHGQYTGLIGKYGKGHLRIVNNLAGGKQGYPMIEVDTVSSDSFSIQTYGLKDILTKRDYRNREKPFDAEKDSVSQLTMHMLLAKEKSLADSLTNTGVITQNTTLSGTNQWNDYTNSNPIGNITVGFNTILDSIGLEPNMAIMDLKTKRYLKFHPALLDKLGYKDNRPGGLSDDELAKALDLERILIGRAVYNSAKEGQTDVLGSVWGKNFVLAHIPATAGLEQMSLGYEVNLDGDTGRKVYKQDIDEPVGAKKIMIEEEYDIVLTNVAAAYLIKNSVA
jgi:hypothetical protein